MGQSARHHGQLIEVLQLSAPPAAGAAGGGGRQHMLGLRCWQVRTIPKLLVLPHCSRPGRVELARAELGYGLLLSGMKDPMGGFWGCSTGAGGLTASFMP